MGHKDDREAYCHFGAHRWVFRKCLPLMSIRYPRVGSRDWRARLIVFVVVLENNFDPFFLWDIGIQLANIECSVIALSGSGVFSITRTKAVVSLCVTLVS